MSTAIYPWDRWLKQAKFRLKRHKDFKCKTHCMSVLVRGAAHNRGKHVSVFIDEDVLTVIVKTKKGRKHA